MVSERIFNFQIPIFCNKQGHDECVAFDHAGLIEFNTAIEPGIERVNSFHLDPRNTRM